jgi:hypothetical protein
MDHMGGQRRRRRVLFEGGLWILEAGDDRKLAFEFALGRHHDHPAVVGCRSA